MGYQRTLRGPVGGFYVPLFISYLVLWGEPMFDAVHKCYIIRDFAVKMFLNDSYFYFNCTSITEIFLYVVTTHL